MLRGKSAVAAVRRLNGFFLGSHDCSTDGNARIGARHEGHRYICLAQGCAGLFEAWRSLWSELVDSGRKLRWRCNARMCQAIGRFAHVHSECVWLDDLFLKCVGRRICEDVGLFLRLSGQTKHRRGCRKRCGLDSAVLMRRISTADSKKVEKARERKRSDTSNHVVRGSRPVGHGRDLDVKCAQ